MAQKPILIWHIVVSSHVGLTKLGCLPGLGDLVALRFICPHPICETHLRALCSDPFLTLIPPSYGLCERVVLC